MFWMRGGLNNAAGVAVKIGRNAEQYRAGFGSCYGCETVGEVVHFELQWQEQGAAANPAMPVYFELHRLRRRADGQVHQVLRVGDAVGVRPRVYAGAPSVAGKQAHGTGLAACGHAVQQLPVGETTAGVGMGGVQPASQ